MSNLRRIGRRIVRRLMEWGTGHAERSPFGQALVDLRETHRKGLFSMSHYAHVRPYMAIRIEKGRQPIPNGYIDRVSEFFHLDVEEKTRLERLAKESRAFKRT